MHCVRAIVNFFVAWCPALLALLAPGDTLSARELLEAGSAAVPLVLVLALYLSLQGGHTLDLATEKLLAACRRRVENASIGVWQLPMQLPLGVLWLLEMHCLGDYNSSYWPTSHPLAKTPVVCMLAKWTDGTERLLPALNDFYESASWGWVRGSGV